MSRYSYTEEELVLAAKNANSISDVIRALNLRVSGGQSALIKRRLEELNIDITHFYNGGKSRHRPLEDYLVLDGPVIGSNYLKVRLIRAGILEQKCSECGMTEWRGQTDKVFDLDHINGNNRDNRIENLRILCALCHRLTPTWGVGIRVEKPAEDDVFSRHRNDVRESAAKKTICGCGRSKSSVSQKCQVCHDTSGARNRYDFKPIEDTVTDVKRFGWRGAASLVGCSDTALKKYLRRNGVETIGLKRQKN